MGSVISEASFHFQRLAQALQQIIQGTGQRTNFRGNRPDVDGFQIAGFAPRNFCGNFLQGSQAPPDAKPDQ